MSRCLLLEADCALEYQRAQRVGMDAQVRGRIARPQPALGVFGLAQVLGHERGQLAKLVGVEAWQRGRSS
jgi:hypothetical protein